MVEWHSELVSYKLKKWWLTWNHHKSFWKEICLLAKRYIFCVKTCQLIKKKHPLAKACGFLAKRRGEWMHGLEPKCWFTQGVEPLSKGRQGFTERGWIWTLFQPRKVRLLLGTKMHLGEPTRCMLVHILRGMVTPPWHPSFPINKKRGWDHSSCFVTALSFSFSPSYNLTSRQSFRELWVDIFRDSSSLISLL